MGRIWARNLCFCLFLGQFGNVAFAIAPLYSTFLHQEDSVSCHHVF